MRSDATPRAWRPRRRGVTLIEMMVTVALVILIMTIIVSVFRTTTNAVRGAQISQELDGNLRRLDATLRQDLVGATARFTPPLDPKDNLGYFEYGENSFADAQGEDTDDWLAFTVKAPPGQPFLGRYWAPATNVIGQLTNQGIQPTIISSQYAEVIYFLRNGNLYRRVLLIVPNLIGNLDPRTSFPTNSSIMGLGGSAVGWFGANDISARPGPLRNGYTNAGATAILPVPNTLGDLTNRENRAFRPRFTNNYVTATGFPDDFTGEGSSANPLPNGIPDFYSTLYPNVLTSNLTVSGGVLVNEVPSNRTQFREPGATADTMPFPYIFPGPYSVANDTYLNLPIGAIHGWTSTSPVGNHSPLDLGDPLNLINPVQLQTYWCWPTWRETLSTAWTDPVFQPGFNSGAQSPGLSGVSPTFQALPPMTAKFRLIPQPSNDGAGTTTFAATSSAYFSAWEDDLIMTGVRSFDIKAYDPNAGFAGATPGYYDLGYNTGTWLSGFSSTLPGGYTGTTPAVTTNYNVAETQLLPTFGHEGRIPPLRADFRRDAQYPTLVPTGTSNFLNVGEDSPGTLRLRRVWDSWSTAYTNAPALPTDPTLGPAFGNRPVYPSYPPPYPAALRGIQIQIRVVNQPDSDRVKVLTIRQDFTDKL